MVEPSGDTLSVNEICEQNEGPESQLAAATTFHDPLSSSSAATAPLLPASALAPPAELAPFVPPVAGIASSVMPFEPAACWVGAEAALPPHATQTPRPSD